MYNTISNSAGQNSSGQPVPSRLAGTERFIKLEQESKAPKVGPDGPFFKADSPELAKWIENGGNVGLNLGDLVALDIDSHEFRQLANDQLPSTFSVRSGSGGEHRYYRSEWSGRRQFSTDGSDIGSVRSGNWYLVVPPSIHPETGERYHVLRDTPITPVPEIQLQDFLEEATDRWGTATASTGGAAAGGAGGTSLPKIPEEYPERDGNWKTTKRWLKSNGLLGKLKLHTGDRSAREFLVAKCLAEGGFSEDTIADAMDRFHAQSKWHQRGQKYQNRTVRKAIVAACDDEHVAFKSPDDSGERGTPDEGKPRSGLSMSEGATFEEKESVVELNGDGGAVQARLMQGTSEDGERFEYVDVATGNVEETETVNGETVRVPNIDDGPGEADSIGSPDSLEAKIVALEKLKEKINE